MVRYCAITLQTYLKPTRQIINDNIYNILQLVIQVCNMIYITRVITSGLVEPMELREAVRTIWRELQDADVILSGYSTSSKTREDDVHTPANHYLVTAKMAGVLPDIQKYGGIEALGHCS